MSRHRFGILVVLLLALGVATAVATPPKGLTSTELARSTIAGPISASAVGESDLAGQMVTFPPGGISPWHSHPGATFVAVKSETLTLYHGNAQSCTSQSYSAGQGFLEPASDVHFAANEGSTPVEAYVTFLASPVGGALRADQQSAGGANCPDPNPIAQGPSQLPRTGGAGLAGMLAALGVGLAGAGTVARSVARRR